MNNENYVCKDELIQAAMALDSAEYIIQEIREEYFECYFSEKKENEWKIIYEFNRNRGRVMALSFLLDEISAVFDKSNITAY